MKLDDFLTTITARNAGEHARLKWENSVLKKILAGGRPAQLPVKRFGRNRK
jgi:hypothetical protein